MVSQGKGGSHSGPFKLGKDLAQVPSALGPLRYGLWRGGAVHWRGIVTQGPVWTCADQDFTKHSDVLSSHDRSLTPEHGDSSNLAPICSYQAMQSQSGSFPVPLSLLGTEQANGASSSAGAYRATGLLH